MFEKMFAQMKKNAAAAREHAENHCGGCRHDCPLSDPGCPVGRDAAIKKQIRDEKRAAKEKAKFSD